jgi:uncharacterized OB-fold protein
MATEDLDEAGNLLIRHELVLQKCRRCGAYQFYARLFCLSCQAGELEWVRAAGTGTIHTMTTVRRQVLPDFPVPFVNAIVELDEGPGLLTTIIGGGCAIGDRVRFCLEGSAHIDRVIE